MGVVVWCEAVLRRAKTTTPQKVTRFGVQCSNAGELAGLYIYASPSAANVHPGYGPADARASGMAEFVGRGEFCSDYLRSLRHLCEKYTDAASIGL